MIVTDLKPLDKKRTKVFLDFEEAFVLYHRELREYGIAQDAELSEEDYREIMTHLLPKRAKLRALHLLEARPYTEFKLREKLRNGHYPEAVIDEAIDYCKSYRYVDDLQYALDYATYHTQDRPKNRIRNDLLAKGIARDIIEQALERAYTQDLPLESTFNHNLPLEGKVAPQATDEVSPEYQLLLKHLRKKHYTPDLPYEERQKLKASLYRKGFSMDLITRALEDEKSLFEDFG